GLPTIRELAWFEDSSVHRYYLRGRQIENRAVAATFCHHCTGNSRNEFHDPIAPNCSPGNSSPGNPCWYNSISYASSTDGGHTFTDAIPPAQLVAPPPVTWDPQGPPPAHGYFNPSNIVLGQDSFFYSIFMAIDRAATKQG